jgi:hypothetical protein
MFVSSCSHAGAFLLESGAAVSQEDAAVKQCPISLHAEHCVHYHCELRGEPCTSTVCELHTPVQTYTPR